MKRAAFLVCVAAALVPTTGTSGARRTHIVFWNTSPWPTLWVMRPDGSGRHLLFRTRLNEKRPVLSADGRWVVFDGSSPGQRPFGNFDIQVVRIDGKWRRTVVGSEQTEVGAQWSPDGSQISFMRAPSTDELAQSSIWIVRRDGSGQRRLTEGASARWSPDGRRLVFSALTSESDADIFVINADGADRRLVVGTPQFESPAGWSPDGTKILFTRFLPRGADVFVMDADGTNIRRLTRTPGDDVAAGWSPGGAKILFTSRRRGPSRLYVMNADGSQQRNLSGPHVNDYDPSWR
jgi:TolB protein